MEGNGHQFCVCARDKDVTHLLLDHFQIKYASKGKSRKGFIGKILFLMKANILLFKLGKKFKPDLFLSFGSPYAAQIAKILGKPHIALDDTEHAEFEHLMYVPFTNCILTPNSFKKNFGVKQIRFDATMDIAYLHPKYYETNSKYLEDLNLVGKTYFFLRFVEWDAAHDFGQSGFSMEGKAKIIELLTKYGEVIISSEGDLPGEFRKYLFEGEPSKIHTILKNASLFISESGSMATEAATLGTPSIMVNSSVKYFGVFEYISKFGNLYYFEKEELAIEKIKYLLNLNNLKQNAIQNAQEFISKSINLTDFMVWFVENYPRSFETMKKNPDYQNNFRQLTDKLSYLNKGSELLFLLLINVLHLMA